MSEYSAEPLQPSRWRTALWAGLGLLLVLGENPRWMAESVRVVDSGEVGVLAGGEAWIPPLASWDAIAAIAEWPYLLYAAAAAVLIAAVATRLASSSPTWLATGLLIGLSLGVQPRDLVVGGLVWATVRWRPKAAWPLLFAAPLIALLVSIEFGFVMLVAGLAAFSRHLQRDALSPMGERVRVRGSNKDGGSSAGPSSGLRPPSLRRGEGTGDEASARLTVLMRAVRVSPRSARVGLGLVGMALALIVLSTLAPDFTAALLRPVNWFWLRPGDLLPSLRTPWATEGLSAAVLLVTLFFVDCWRQTLRTGSGVVLLSVLTVIGFGCGRYLWICVFAAAFVATPAIGRGVLPRVDRLVLLGGFLFAGLRIVPQADYYHDYFLLGSVPPRMVDAAAWDIEGRVMLLDLEQSDDWRVGKSAETFDLLVDDRWDVFAEDYADYAAVCRDLARFRDLSYRRTDGEWGGYTRRMNEWRPSLLVAPSEEIETIRSLSLNPHWNVLGIDAERTIFGRAADPRTRPQAGRALATVMTLEWPRGAAGVDPGVMVAGDEAERLSVAGVLCAMRLPYAALRIMPEGEESEALRTWCYLELAYRARQHTGRASLLDQYRAVHRLREPSTLEWPASDLLRAAHSLEGLDLPDLAGQLADEALARRGLSDEERGTAQALIERCASFKVEASSDSAESIVREALECGDAAGARSAISELEEPVARYYGVLARALERTPFELYPEFLEAIESPGMPERLVGEARFLAACLAIEVGDAPGAVELLRTSEAADPHSPYRELRSMYLRQLGG